VNVGSNGYANKLKYLFLCGSVVIHVHDGSPNHEFFEHQLLPGMHYYSVSRVEEVAEAVRYLRAHPAQARAIAAAGTSRPCRNSFDANFGWEIERSPRPPNLSNASVARAEGYTYAANVWALSVVQGPFILCRPVPNHTRPIRNTKSHCALWDAGRHEAHGAAFVLRGDAVPGRHV
jgi:hypothetical protein